jgi:hypothetical protein
MKTPSFFLRDPLCLPLLRAVEGADARRDKEKAVYSSSGRRGLYLRLFVAVASPGLRGIYSNCFWLLKVI